DKDDPDDDDKSKAKGKQFSQDDLDEKVKAAKARQKRGFENRLKEILGGKTPEEIKVLVDKAADPGGKGKKDKDDDEPSAAATAAAEEAARKSERATALAEAATLRADAVTALVLAGINPKKISRAAK